jgi:hypothetical protein
MKRLGRRVVDRAQQVGRHRIRYWNQVGFWVKADFASGSAVKYLAIDPHATFDVFGLLYVLGTSTAKNHRVELAPKRPGWNN